MASPASTTRDHASPDEAPIDTGLRSLMLMAGFHGIPADEAGLRHDFGHGALFSNQPILLAARRLGFKVRLLKQDPARLHLAPLPAMAQDQEGRYFIVAKLDGMGTADSTDTGVRARVLIQRPGESPQVLALTSFLDQWTGELILFTSKATFAGETARFDFTWFIPAVVKYRRMLGEVLLISLVLQLIGLVTPMAFQVVMDKVLVNHAMKTLNVIAIGLILATLFEAVLTAIRTYVFRTPAAKSTSNWAPGCSRTCSVYRSPIFRRARSAIR